MINFQKIIRCVLSGQVKFLNDLDLDLNAGKTLLPDLVFQCQNELL